MVQPFQIDPNAFYSDRVLVGELGFRPGAVTRARREGALRHVRRGGRTLYLGAWVLDWLTDGSQARPLAEEAAVHA